jgi:hypothetical protein
LLKRTSQWVKIHNKRRKHFFGGKDISKVCKKMRKKGPAKRGYDNEEQLKQNTVPVAEQN